MTVQGDMGFQGRSGPPGPPGVGEPGPPVSYEVLLFYLMLDPALFE